MVSPTPECLTHHRTQDIRHMNCVFPSCSTLPYACCTAGSFGSPGCCCTGHDEVATFQKPTDDARCPSFEFRLGGEKNLGNFRTVATDTSASTTISCIDCGVPIHWRNFCWHLCTDQHQSSNCSRTCRDGFKHCTCLKPKFGRTH